MYFIYLHRLVCILGYIFSLEGSGICFLVLVDRKVCNLNLLLIYALEGSFRPCVVPCSLLQSRCLFINIIHG